MKKSQKSEYQKISLNYRQEDKERVLLPIENKIKEKLEIHHFVSNFGESDIREIFNTVPGELRGSTHLFESQLIPWFRSLPMQKGQERAAAIELVYWLACMEDQKNASTKMRGQFGPKAGTPGFMQSSNRKAAFWKRVAALAVFGFSAGTTFLTVKNYAGDLLQSTQLSPPFAEIIKWIVALLVAFITSSVIYVAKREIERMIEEGKSLKDACWSMFKDKYIFTMIALVLLGLSILSNGMGGAVLVAERQEFRDQLSVSTELSEKALGEINKVLEDTKQRLSREQVLELQNQILEAEATGNSASGRRGEGHFYHAKKFFFTLNPESLNFVNDNRRISSEWYLEKISRLRELVDQYRRHPYCEKRFSANIRTISDPYFDAIQEKIILLEAELLKLKRGSLSHESANVKLLKIENLFKEIITGDGSTALSLENLKKDIEAYTSFATDFISKANTLADSSGQIELESLNPKIPEIAIPKTQLKPVIYKSPIEVAKFYVAKNGFWGLILVSLIVIFCIILDLLDMYDVRKLASRVELDRARVTKYKGQYLNPMLTFVIQIASKRLNGTVVGSLHHQDLVSKKCIYAHLKKVLMSSEKEFSNKPESIFQEMIVGAKNFFKSWFQLNTLDVVSYNSLRNEAFLFGQNPRYFKELYLKILNPLADSQDFFEIESFPNNALSMERNRADTEGRDLIMNEIASLNNEIDYFRNGQLKLINSKNSGNKDKKRREAHVLFFNWVNKSSRFLEKMLQPGEDLQLKLLPSKTEADFIEVKLKYPSDQSFANPALTVKHGIKKDEIDAKSSSDSNVLTARVSLLQGENPLIVSVRDSIGRKEVFARSVLAVSEKTEIEAFHGALSETVQIYNNMAVELPLLIDKGLLEAGYTPHSSWSDVCQKFDLLYDQLEAQRKKLSNHSQKIMTDVFLQPRHRRDLLLLCQGLDGFLKNKVQIQMEEIQKVLTLKEHEFNGLGEFFEKAKTYRVLIDEDFYAFDRIMVELLDRFKPTYGFVTPELLKYNKKLEYKKPKINFAKDLMRDRKHENEYRLKGSVEGGRFISKVKLSVISMDNEFLKDQGYEFEEIEQETNKDPHDDLEITIDERVYSGNYRLSINLYDGWGDKLDEIVHHMKANSIELTKFLARKEKEKEDLENQAQAESERLRKENYEELILDEIDDLNQKVILPYLEIAKEYNFRLAEFSEFSFEEESIAHYLREISNDSFGFEVEWKPSEELESRWRRAFSNVKNEIDEIVKKLNNPVKLNQLAKDVFEYFRNKEKADIQDDNIKSTLLMSEFLETHRELLRMAIRFGVFHSSFPDFLSPEELRKFSNEKDEPVSDQESSDEDSVTQFQNKIADPFFEILLRYRKLILEPFDKQEIKNSAGEILLFINNFEFDDFQGKDYEKAIKCIDGIVERITGYLLGIEEIAPMTEEKWANFREPKMALQSKLEKHEFDLIKPFLAKSKSKEHWWIKNFSEQEKQQFLVILEGA